MRIRRPDLHGRVPSSWPQRLALVQREADLRAEHDTFARREADLQRMRVEIAEREAEMTAAANTHNVEVLKVTVCSWNA